MEKLDVEFGAGEAKIRGPARGQAVPMGIGQGGCEVLGACPSGDVETCVGIPWAVGLVCVCSGVMEKPPAIDVEVLPPEPGEGGAGGGTMGGSADLGDRGVAFHPAAVFLMLVVDQLWMLAEWVAAAWIVTIPLSFLTVFVPSVMIHRRMRGDTLALAVVKSLMLAVVAAVPTSVTGTPIGLALLAWAGIRQMDVRPPRV